MNAYPSHKVILPLAFVASLVSLAAAYIMQLGFGLHPCHLCLLQRVPFAVVIALSCLGWLKPAWRNAIMLLIGFSFLINSGIAGYHAAVEKEWLPGPSTCTSGEAPAHQSMDDFLKRIQSAPIVACDQPQWDFHGITMAGVNTVWCLFLALTIFAALQHSRNRKNNA